MRSTQTLFVALLSVVLLSVRLQRSEAQQSSLPAKVTKSVSARPSTGLASRTAILSQARHLRHAGHPDLCQPQL
jgi:hypothetical protein